MKFSGRGCVADQPQVFYVLRLALRAQPRSGKPKMLRAGFALQEKLILLPLPHYGQSEKMLPRGEPAWSSGDEFLERGAGVRACGLQLNL